MKANNKKDVEQMIN